MSHLTDAQELMDTYPNATKGFTVFEVERIWEEFSDSLAAGWINPDSESVRAVFHRYRGVSDQGAQLQVIRKRLELRGLQDWEIDEILDEE